MRLVLTLVAGAAAGELDPATVRSAVAALRASGADPAEPRWLAPGRACDLDLVTSSDADAAGIEQALRGALEGLALDLAVQPVEGRRKRLLLADMDATIVVGETLDELAAQAGLGECISEITRRAMRGELDFAAALRERVALLAGLPAEAIHRTVAGIRLAGGARALVQTMKAHGATTVLVSGGFRQFAERAGALAGFDEVHANRLVIRDERLTGEVEEPILGRDAKLELLRTLLSRHGLAGHEACTVGDGANDLDMIAAAGLGVAYHGKPAVRAAASCRIDHADLSALLFFQGYGESDFSS